MATFLEEAIARASAAPRTIVLPEGEDPRTLIAAKEILERKIARLVILGPAEQIRSGLTKIGADPGGLSIEDPADSDRIDAFAEGFYELRKHKGVTLEEARAAVRDVMYYGTMMVKTGLADGLVAGAAHSTPDTIRPALQIIKSAEGIRTVSSLFFMCWPDKTLLFADCGLNQDPDEKQLADIALATARTALQFGIEPRIALLSYSSKGSSSGTGAGKMAAASQRAKEAIAHALGEHIPVDGELQFDAAYVPAIAAKKAPDSPLKGQANVFIFPDLGAGNICYKAVQRLAGAEAYGPVLQGLALPVNDLSRGCSAEDIVATVAITSIQAQQ